MDTEPSQIFDEVQEGWISCHLYYHQNLNLALKGFVDPLLRDLIKASRINAFFFLYYALGGPHIRLRLRTLPDSREYVVKEIRRFAQDFLDQTPSKRSLDEEAIRKSNEYILASDPHETDVSVYPDNSFQIIPFRPEIQRYGGLNNLRASLEFFSLSSVVAIDFLSKYVDGPRSVQLAQAFRLLLQQALGFAVNELELSELLGYGVNFWGSILPRVVEKGDKVAWSQMDAFLQLFNESVTEAHSSIISRKPFGKASDFLVIGANRLSAAIETGDHVTRARIGSSQLHMTASRLGLSNAEEVYISRLLTVILREARAVNRGNFSWLGEALVIGPARNPRQTLGKLLLQAIKFYQNC